jgi:hypothetical protein
VRGPLAPVHVDDRQLAVARHRHVAAARIGDDRQVAKLDRAVGGRLEARRLVELGRAADVEGPHRQLGARLTDRLRRDDADRLADIDRRTAGEIAPVALGAHAILALADQRRADAHRLDLQLVDQPRADLVDQLAFLGDGVAGLGIDHVLDRRAAQDALAERSDSRAALDDGAHLQIVVGLAVQIDDHAILRHVDQAAGQVTRVRVFNAVSARPLRAP